MNNQAAQTMPELPDSQYRGGNDVFGKEFPLYTADQMHQYARDYAASQTAGVPDGWMRDVADAAAALDKRGDRQMAARLMRLHKDMLAAAPAASGGECAALHPATDDLVRRFSDALRAKLAAAEMKYGYSDGWASPDWMDECRKHLMQHIAKGDPRDVAAYCAFLWHHGESTTPQPPAAASVSERARELLAAEYERANFPDIAKTIREGGYHWDSIRALELRALEQALTQQRVRPACASATESYCCACGWASVESTPQPGAEALRELVRKWRELSVSMPLRSYTGATLDKCADELESLLSAASGDKGVG